MAKFELKFNDKNYSIDDTSIADASAGLKSHLQNKLNGQGASIKLGGTSYSVDSTKLSAIANKFITHLGTVSGEGYIVKVGNTEYGVASSKMTGAVSALEAVLDGFGSEYGGIVTYTDVWESKTVKNGNPASGYNFAAGHIWTDGKNAYYSYQASNQYVFNGDEWVSKTWQNPIGYGESVWTDGTNIYYSSKRDQYVLQGDTWVSKTWKGLTSFEGEYVWTDGKNIYYSCAGGQYVLQGDAWKSQDWEGLYNFYGDNIWTDGTNMYYSDMDEQYVLRGNAWVQKTWNIEIESGNKVWTDGTNIYYSSNSDQYVLQGDTWVSKTWKGLTSFNGSGIWRDGTNIYHASGGTTKPTYHMLKKAE